MGRAEEMEGSKVRTAELQRLWRQGPLAARAHKRSNTDVYKDVYVYKCIYLNTYMKSERKKRAQEGRI